MATKTVLFVHGLFVNYQCWDDWVSRYEAKGYKCIAVRYPHRDKTVEELRKAHPDPELTKVTFGAVLDYLVQTVKGLDEPPIIIGHSFGGLFTQLLLNRGLGAAGVSIDPAPPMGVMSFKWSFLKSGWPLLNPLSLSSRPYMMPFSAWQYAFVNGMSLEEQQKAYERSTVPESIRLGRGALGPKSRIDFKKAHSPLLIYAGEIDHIIPASLNKANFKRYKASSSVTDFKEWPGRNHYGIDAPGWEELADYALEWVGKQGV